VRNEYKKQGQESRHQFNQNIEMIKILNEKRISFDQSLNQSKDQLDRNILSNERKLATLTSRLNECEKSSTELCKLNSDLESLQHALSNNIHSTKEHDEIEGLSKKLQQIDYSPIRHREVEKEIEDLAPYSEMAGTLYTAEENLRHLKNSLSSSICTIDNRREDIEKWQRELDAITTQVQNYGDTKTKITTCTFEIDQLQEQLSSDKFIQQKATLDLKKIATLENELDSMTSTVRTDSEEANIYDELSTAFGKNGIQALMIERAVPQIQENANQLLSRLTDNRLSVKLELHEGRIDRLTGVRSEELYINISDEIGTRSYETFSGGESFRIDFAIRIALSKILSSRSGAPLPILFIDEGFGSQDSSGQERLIEAIQSIQGEFEKIIVITHMDQMKEQFEDTIEVIKTDQGSTFLTV
jgi:exonuclease SbcC